jgi:short-subunit dehydrogenase
MSLKPLNRQTIVITGASSGIGLATAYMAAERGAKLVLVSRNDKALSGIVRQIRSKGGQAIHVVADVSKRADHEAVAKAAIRAFGSFDTWVNNAGLSVFGRLDEISDEDHRQVIDVNFWGVVYGSTVAAHYLRRNGGAIVNLGSVASDVALPLQGMYTASKHAIKGFTDAFRMELAHEGAPISLTLIKPASINTPFPVHAKNYMKRTPKLPPPIYKPEDVARAILHAAEHGGRDYYIGGGGKVMSLVNQHLPGLVDKVGAHMMLHRTYTNERATGDQSGALFRAGRDGDVHGETPHMVMPAIYTRATMRPVLSTALLAVAGLAVTALLGAKKGS